MPPVTVHRGTPLVLSRRVYLTILSLLAVSFMLFQIAVLRELRFQLSTVFTLTPFLFSGVIVFIGLGALVAGRIRSKSQTVLAWSVTSLPILLLPLFGVTIIVSQGMIDHASAGFAYVPGAQTRVAGDLYLRSIIRAFLAVGVFGYGFVFLLQGLVFALYFREAREEGSLSNVYAVDLLASGLGALVGGALNFVLTPVQMVLVATGLLLVNLWTSFRFLPVRRILVLAASVAGAGLIAVELATGVLEQLEAPRWLGRELVYSQWSRYRRIDVADYPRTLVVLADGLVFHELPKNERPDSLPAWLAAHADHVIRDVLIIGSGTGADVRSLRKLPANSLNIVAVEIDGGFVDAARVFPWLWQDYRTANIVVQEGRYFLENSRQAFDLVVYAYIDPQSAISDIGLPDANFLYTDAGLRRAYERVRPGGYLVITRVFLVRELDEFVSRLCATLTAAGVPPEEVQLSRTRDTVAWGYYGELATIHVLVRKGGRPPDDPNPALAPIVWVKGGRPTTDLFPLSMVTGVWFETLIDFLTRSTPALVALAVAALALVGRLVTSVGHLNFFLLGFGSFLLESLVLFNSFLLLGDPNLSASVAVGMFLCWNGIGSLLSTRLDRTRWLYGLAPLTVLVYAATAPLLNTTTIGLHVGTRTLAFALHLALGAIVAGAMFPIALRRFRQERVSSMFFIDLVGCALGPVAFWLALSLVGIPLVAASAVLCYALVGVTLALRRSSA